jgi:predicted HTH domain antitoxin
MPVSISDEFLISSHLTESELKIELAVALFQNDRLTLGQASRLAEMGQLEFQKILASRSIPIHYGIDDLEADLRTIRTAS